MMYDVLRRRNLNLSQDSEALSRSLQDAKIPPELEPYRDAALQFCQEVIRLANQNLARLSFLGKIDVLEDLLSDTRMAINLVQILSTILAHPILRASSADRLSLQFIGWLHQTHPQTVACPPAFSNGQWQVMPLRGLPIYGLPSVEQHSLLYQPLFCHEYGHVLYAYHQPELDELVRELQYKIIDILMPGSQRNDAFAKRQGLQRQTIANIWYGWIQELYCDAVGFTVAGPSYLYAFSSYLAFLRSDDFYNEPEDLKTSTHPVKWLRIHLLAARAARLGFVDLAVTIESEWREVAEAMGIVEDYHGFYDESLEQAIVATIEDMLVETGPRVVEPIEAEGKDWSPASDSPIRLLNWAWQMHLDAPEKYKNWERRQIERLLGECQYVARPPTLYLMSPMSRKVKRMN